MRGNTPPLSLSPSLALRRYGALKTLGEKKAAFNEFVQQRKKEEAEEARQRPRPARGGGGGGAALVARCLALRCRAPHIPTPTPHPASLQAKEGFYKMLDECERLAVAPKFSRARDLLELDARWQVLQGGKGWLCVLGWRPGVQGGEGRVRACTGGCLGARRASPRTPPRPPC